MIRRTAAVLAAASLIGLAACGDDDDDVTYNDGSLWFTSTSPSGQAVECIEYGATIWCRDVEVP